MNKQPQKKKILPPQKQNQRIPPKTQQGQDRNHSSPKEKVINPANRKLFPIENINNAIHEYLLKNNYLKTLSLFQEELLNYYSANKSSVEEINFEQQMLEDFENGNRDLFYEKWNSYVPINIRFEDMNCSKLDFYLQIYFLIFPIHPLFKKSQQILDKATVLKYKKYLETKGSELSKTSEFLPYYALPYIQKPQEHPALKELFTKEWIFNLRNKLIEFLTNLFNPDSSPFLVQIYQYYANNKQNANISPHSSNLIEKSITKDNSNQQYINYIAQLESNNKELVNVIQEFNVKYNQMQKNYKQFAESAKGNLMESQNKWSAVAKELVSISKEFIKSIDGLKNGGELNEKKIELLINKTYKYEKFLNTNIEELISQSQDVSIFEKASTINENDKYSELNISPIQNPKEQFFAQEQLVSNKNVINSYTPINFNKIKEVFKNNENEKLVCALLQALRWRITRTKYSQIRREVIMNYSLHDILGCNPKEDIIQDNLLINSNRKIKEFSLRLINALASDYYGRIYLVKNDKSVIRLIEILKGENQDSLVRRNTLGALQKLSLRKRPQIIMIENGLIRWIISTLQKEKDTLSEYSLEYTTALFMNLSLRSAGKLKCEDPNEEVLKVLNELLEHENMQVRTFVNGTLYSLFSRASIREQAKAIGMHEILKYLMENSDERFMKQIVYIMDQLNVDKDKDELSESNDEDNDVEDLDEDDDVVEEEELEESIDIDKNFPLGEDLLFSEFVLKGEDGIKQKLIIKSMMEENKSKTNENINIKENRMSDVPFNRPTTPIISSNNTIINQNYENERSILPSELKSRPKIVRTPAEVNKVSVIPQNIDTQIQKENNVNNTSLSYNYESPFMNEKKIELRKMAETSEEYKSAFESRSKIMRTPPNPNQKLNSNANTNSNANSNANPNQN